MELIDQHRKEKATRKVMIVVFVLMAGIFIPRESTAQTFAEWFSQKKTQKKYLLEQIAALQVFSGYLHQGYQIASGGLGSISGYIKEENGLHAAYYDRLKIAGSEVRNNPMVQEIMAKQKDITNRLQGMERIANLSPAERDYIKKVCAAVLSDCARQLDDLQLAIGDDRAAMSDSERLELIKRVHGCIADNYRFASRFTAQAKLISVQRLQEQRQVGVAKKLYSIN
jgi:hypothetical protein